MAGLSLLDRRSCQVTTFIAGLFFTAQGTAQAAQQSQSLFSVKTTAQQGFKGVETCADKSNPTGVYCTTSDGTKYLPTVASGLCNAGDNMVQNNGVCMDGSDPTTQSPGQTTGMMLNQSLGTTPKLIAGATTIDGIINAFTISLIETLASTLVKTATGAINSKLNSLSTVSTAQLDAAASSTATSTISEALACDPSQLSISAGDDAMFVVDEQNGGGTYDANGNPPNYTWTASPDGGVGAPIIEEGDSFDMIYNIPNAPGSLYTVTLSDSVGDPSASCFVTVTSTPALVPPPAQG